MKTQIVYIHGGDTHESYDEYIDYLKKYAIKNLDYFKRKRWGNSLQEKLGNNFEVIAPEMPNKRNVKYKEWKIWFEKIFPFLNDEVVLVGSSLGGIFLTKYLSENIFPKKIKGLFVVAAPFGDSKPKHFLAGFNLPNNLKKIMKQTEKIYFYHSKDDPIVPFVEMKKYKKELANAKYIVFANRGHFSQEKFPEIVKDIKNLGR